MQTAEWFEIRGCDGYVMTADGMRVHSLPKRFRFGNQIRVLKGQELHRGKQGYYQLRVDKNQKRFYPHELLPLKGNKVEGLE